MAITDFNSWLDEASPDDFEEIYCIYRAVADNDSFGCYKCEENNGKFFLKADHVSETLMLASEKAKNAFLEQIRKQYCDGTDDIEMWYGYSRAMAKDD